MLRTSLRSVRAVGSRPVAAASARQWQPAIARSPAVAARRSYADDKKPSINDSTPAKLPTSETNTAAASDPPALKTESKVASSTIGSKDVPHTPPPAPPTSTRIETKAPPPPPAPVRKKKGFFRRLRNYLLTLIFLGAVTFGGGIWYSRISDNFHDFFTEYVPFGEQAVLYFEELEYRKRYPGGLTIGGRNKDTGAQVKISPQSGASWRVADAGEPAGRQSSAVRDLVASKSSASGPEKKDAPAAESKKSKAKPTEPPKGASPEPAKAVEKQASPQAPAKPDSKKEAPAFKAPEVDEPSRFPPASPIDPLSVNDADVPVVQDLVKMLNDIITVVNADNADDRFSSTIGKAKNELNKVGAKIRELKAQVEKDAASQVSAKVKEFEGAANELVFRVEKAMEAQEKQWRVEFDEEMRHVQAAYDARMKTELEREKQINEQKLNNLLLEQAVDLKRQFLKEVKDRVEEERNGRLGRLEQLSSAIKELENLTTGWNDVVDLNLKTQQLHVAVEAVRASLNDAEHPRPFVRELVALKEIATDDEVVNAAIRSINPSAYQRGIATPSQLIDRFRRVATEVRKASLLPEDAGVASHASSWLLSKVMFKKQGLAVGDDVESILTRTQTYLEEGDLDAAAREMNGLQGWAKTLSRDWLSEVRKVLEVQQALEVRSPLPLFSYDFS
ncbi:mitochondrial inner membrane protein-domain-containing protein [Annulohypoxylon truncatum]|uniref:mitochondrial inner membrane protein-domain-containing protein n=1 Tax=Annulohypoxylon truncatum TaxID=327061 RepID=UPI002007AF72|nr:mitochondrial inner membrane protein-domain-containing protein [Annulohypoxylon truncatum]KAI1204800.1 mitochondrial inner membrane protein-domain-containing protein [Annulohypoxylon truncatum]